MKPLGEYEAFRRWSGKPRAWGPDDKWRAWFGGGVVNGLCEVLNEHLTAGFPRDMGPAAIGCVPWLTSTAVVDQLLKLRSCCVVIDKGASTYALDELHRRSGFPNAAITGLEEMMPALNGSAPLTVGPGTPREATWHEIEAVRVAGWKHGDRKPLAHAKLLVLGAIGWVRYDSPYGEHEEFRFEPQRVWWGSANWTELSSSHLETGFVCDDPQLVRAAADFVTEMIAFSEPITTTCPAPEPNLVFVDYDKAAIAEAAAERDYGEPDDYDDY